MLLDVSRAKCAVLCHSVLVIIHARQHATTASSSKSSGWVYFYGDLSKQAQNNK